MARTDASERTLHLGGQRAVTVRWVRDRRARRLRLSVSERGVRLTLPWRACERHAEDFLQQHQDWLLQRLDEMPDADSAAPLRPGETCRLPLWGEDVALDWAAARYARVQAAGEDPSVAGLRFTLPPKPRAGGAQAALRDFYLAQVRAEIGRQLPGLLPTLPRAPSRFRVQPLASLWGSLSPAAVVSLDLALVLAPPDLLRYVLVHELCHLIEPNHSPAFWAQVQQRCPDWRAARGWLREHGLPLKARLRALLSG